MFTTFLCTWVGRLKITQWEEEILLIRGPATDVDVDPESLSFSVEFVLETSANDCKKIDASLRYGLSVIFLQPLVSNSTEKNYL